MTLRFAIVFTTAHLEDVDLVVLALCHHSGFNTRTGNQGRPNRQIRTAADSQHLIDHDFLANVRSNLFYHYFFTGNNLVLLTTGFYDRVHVSLFEKHPAWRGENWRLGAS